MSDKPENPPAFPGPDDVWMGDSPQGGGDWASSYGQAPHQGMTLRDYFAAHAPLTQLDGETWEEHAEERYQYADAMLAERIK